MKSSIRHNHHPNFSSLHGFSELGSCPGVLQAQRGNVSAAESGKGHLELSSKTGQNTYAGSFSIF